VRGINVPSDSVIVRFEDDRELPIRLDDVREIAR
jgi:hypothetical protein